LYLGLDFGQYGLGLNIVPLAAEWGYDCREFGGYPTIWFAIRVL
jgi:hypothetical protein